MNGPATAVRTLYKLQKLRSADTGCFPEASPETPVRYALLVTTKSLRRSRESGESFRKTGLKGPGPETEICRFRLPHHVAQRTQHAPQQRPTTDQDQRHREKHQPTALGHRTLSVLVSSMSVYLYSFIVRASYLYRVPSSFGETFSVWSPRFGQPVSCGNFSAHAPRCRCRPTDIKSLQSTATGGADVIVPCPADYPNPNSAAPSLSRK